MYRLFFRKEKEMLIVDFLIENYILMIMLIGMFIITLFDVYLEKSMILEYDPTVIRNEDGAAEDYKVTLEYTVNGKKYTTEFNASEGEYNVGQQVELRYDPENPQNNVQGEISLPLLIVICAAAVIIGAIIFIKNIM